MCGFCVFFFFLHYKYFMYRSLKRFYSYLNVLLIKRCLHSYRVQYLHKTYIVFHFNDNIRFAVKLNLIELEITGNLFRSHLYLFSVYEFCVSDGSFII